MDGTLDQAVSLDQRTMR